MGYLQSLSPNEIQHYHRMLTRSVEVRSHFDMLVWLQGDMQHYLAHDIMITAWGDFDGQALQHNIISTMAGVRSQDADAVVITPLLLQLFARWTEFGRKPFSINVGDTGFELDASGPNSALKNALHSMRCALVHGIKDHRSKHDCLYVAFSVKPSFSENERSIMALVLPHVDSALRQVAHLPHQTQPVDASPVGVQLQHDFGLSEREAEVLHWVAAGKTNPEIGMILDISAYTVKNHLQRVFKKLDVTNRAQAVNKIKTLLGDV
jgi:transcriptional regulator EpsA